MVTPLEQNVYNTYLRIVRSSQNKPFTLRKNFKGFEDNPNYPKVKKISNLLAKCPHINIDDYFIAPYKVYEIEDDQAYTLDFYRSMKCLGCYKQYMVIKELCDPDESHQLDFVANSFRFIGKFCFDHNISFKDYLTYKKGFTYEWMKHYAEKKISLLCLLEYDNIYDMIMGIEDEHRSLLLGDLDRRFYKVKLGYNKSTKCKSLVKNTINKLEQILNNRQDDKE